MGAIYGMLNKVSLYRMEVDSAWCISCGACSRGCPMDVNPALTPNSAECIRCGRCVTDCPTEALSVGFKLRTIESNKIDSETAM